jgi:hypothetical protein
VRNKGSKQFDITMSLFSRPFGEYQAPGQEGPRQTTTTHPRFFLTGATPGRGLGDLDRRKALAGAVTAPDNYYFAAAFVNRVLGELLGQAFVEPVDNLGPLQPAIYSDVLVRLAQDFRASGHDVKALYRTVMNIQAYQRQMRMGESSGAHIRFAGSHPTRLRHEALWTALSTALGRLDPLAVVPGTPKGFGGRRSPPLFVVFRDLFAFDPSLRQDEVEGTVPQALMLMNNDTINARMKATGKTVLAGILKNRPRDEGAVRQLYLRVLGRQPTANELKIALAHVREVGKRETAFEDLLWVLINSAEFRTRR